MPVVQAPTPNPNALKFTVGVAVGGPGTFVKGTTSELSFVNSLLELDGVTSIFMTADFVTISKASNSSWDAITPEATAILEAEFAS